MADALNAYLMGWAGLQILFGAAYGIGWAVSQMSFKQESRR